MGGSGSGGSRVGAGRKRDSARAHRLRGDAGKRRLALVEAPADAGHGPRAPAAPVGPPAMLTEPEAAYWRLWEPLARELGTLSARTMPGFVLLCQVACRAARAWAEVERDGLTYVTQVANPDGTSRDVLKSHPALSHYRGLAQRQEQLFARYGLAAMGKPTEARPDHKPDAERDELRRLLAIT